MSEWSKKKLYTLRYLSYWLYVFCTIGIPIILIGWQYDIFKKPPAIQLTLTGVILAIIVIFILRGHIKQVIADMEISITKTIIVNLGKMLPWIACWFIMAFLSSSAEKVQFILFWFIVGNIIALFIDVWHTALYKECKNRERGK